MSLIEVKNLALGYGGHTVLENINLTIDAGDFWCVVGPNGAGKSTFVKGLLGIIKPSAGEIKFHDLKQKFIGYMPQETKVDANFPASVLEIVMSGTLNRLGMRPFYTRKEKAVAAKNLKILGIENLRERNFCDLSGGQRQKVLLARSLCATTKMLILDEPSNNLDKKSKDELYKTIAELNKRQRITVVMITHDLDHDNLIGNKILSLRGNDVFCGTTEEFVRKIHHE